MYRCFVRDLNVVGVLERDKPAQLVVERQSADGAQVERRQGQLPLLRERAEVDVAWGLADRGDYRISAAVGAKVGAARRTRYVGRSGGSHSTMIALAVNATRLEMLAELRPRCLLA